MEIESFLEVCLAEKRKENVTSRESHIYIYIF